MTTAAPPSPALRLARRYVRWYHHVYEPRGYRIRGCFALYKRLLARGAASGRVVRVGDVDGDLVMELDLAEHIARAIFWYGAYSVSLRRLMDRLLKPDWTVLDIGANIGELTLYAAKRVPQGRVHAFEPIPDRLAVLRANVAANPFANIAIHPVALGEAEATLTLYLNRAVKQGVVNAGSASLKPAGEGAAEAVEVAVRAADEVLAEAGTTRVDFIKMDIEGAEPYALRGLSRTLATYRPDLVFEVNPTALARGGFDRESVLAPLRELGYRFACLDETGGLGELPEPEANHDVYATAQGG